MPPPGAAEHELQSNTLDVMARFGAWFRIAPCAYGIVEIITCWPFTVDIELENQGCSRARRGTFDNRKRVRRGTFDTRVLQSTTLGVAEHNASVEEREHMTGRRGFA